MDSSEAERWAEDVPHDRVNCGPRVEYGALIESRLCLNRTA